MTVVAFARLLSISRSNAYVLFERRSIDTNMLSRISRVLDYDFFSVYTEKLKQEE